MTIQLTGVLSDPTGTPLNSATIRITTLGNHTSVIDGSTAKVTTSLTGNYDFSLVEGKFKIEINQTNKFNQVAWVEVTNLTTTPITLDSLINIYAYCEKVAPSCTV
jgi:hypothetical protein